MRAWSSSSFPEALSFERFKPSLLILVLRHD